MQIIQIHISQEHAQPAATQATTSKPTKIAPPSVDIGIDQEEWNTFKIRWRQYCNGVKLPEELKPLQLFNCATPELGNLMLKADEYITDGTVKNVM